MTHARVTHDTRAQSWMLKPVYLKPAPAQEGKSCGY